MSDDTRRRKVLVVEDSAPQRQRMEDLLTRAGLEVESVGDGRAGRERALQERYDAIVSDIVLPGCSGFDLCRAVKDSPSGSEVTVVLVSGMSDSSNFMQSVRSGADAYLPKSTPSERLVKTIRDLLEQRAARNRGRDGSGSNGS